MSHAVQLTTLSHAYFDVQLKKHFKANRFNLLRLKHIVIPNGAEDFWFDNKFTRKGIEGVIKILFVGLLSKNKNLDAVISVCQSLSIEGLKLELHIVGDGPRASEFKNHITNFPVIFYGHITDRKTLMDLYRRTDLLFVPSFTESFGIVYVEAMSQSLPVIYTKNQGFDGFFPNGTVGFAVDPYNIDEMKDAVKNVIRQYNKISELAIEKSKNFKWDEPVKLLMNCYNSIS